MFFMVAINMSNLRTLAQGYIAFFNFNELSLKTEAFLSKSNNKVP